jgi:hypothetical protein
MGDSCRELSSQIKAGFKDLDITAAEDKIVRNTEDLVRYFVC